jgi:hypothetical protein
MWQFTGKQRPSFAIEPNEGQEGQESVWEYPRPPICVEDSREAFANHGTPKLRNLYLRGVNSENQRPQVTVEMGFGILGGAAKPTHDQIRGQRGSIHFCIKRNDPGLGGLGAPADFHSLFRLGRNMPYRKAPSSTTYAATRNQLK